MERPQTGIPTDRPKTRWSRGSPDARESSAVTIRASSKMERPQSRRGVTKLSMQEGRESAQHQRPVSTTFFINNRTSATGSRLNSAARLNTGYNTMINTQRAFDRPVTGVRPISTRGHPRLSRLVQDKRYYEGMMQLKMRELSHEIDSIKRGIERQNKEKATFVHFDRRAKDLATELAELQGQLADYNTVLDKMTSNTEKSTIEQAANELASVNEQIMSEIEEMFEQRQKAEQKLRELRNEIDQEKKNADKIVMMMEPSTRAKYDELCSQKMRLKDEIDSTQQQVETLITEKNKLEEGIALSQIKQEAVKLHVKIMEIEMKRDRLLDESQNKLSPKNEKSKLLEKVKQDNVEITAAENRMVEIKKQISQTEQQLEQLDRDLQDNYSEKGARYKEFHKKEQLMEEFLSTFDQNKLEEQEKLIKTERTIVDKLEKISSNVSGTVFFDDDDDIFDIQLDDDEKMSPRDIGQMKTQYANLQHTFLKLKALESRFKREKEELTEKLTRKENELKSLEELNRRQGGSREKSPEELAAEKEVLVNEKKDCSNELEELSESFQQIQDRLNKNEIYTQIRVLEQKSEGLKQNIGQIQSYVDDQRSRVDYSSLKDKANVLVSQYNVNLKMVVK